jgi:tetratricopeptide (TPR) repeat protein
MKYLSISLLTLLLLACGQKKNLQETNTAVNQKEDIENLEFRNKALDHYNKGNFLLSEGNISLALNEFYEALVYDQNSADIYESIADILIRQGKIETAQLNYQKALKIDSLSKDVLIKSGNINVRMGNEKEAINNFKKVLSIDSSHPQAFELICFLYNKIKDKNSLLDFIENYAEKVEMTDDLAVKIAGYYAENQLKEKAKYWANIAMVINPNNQNAKILLSQMDIQWGNKNEALKSLKKLYEENPTNLNMLFQVLNMLRQEKAFDTIIKYINESEVKDQVLNLFLGEAHYNLTHYPKAQEAFNQVKINRFDIYYELIAADTEFRLENYETALVHFTSIQERAPQIAEGYYGAALSLMEQKDYKEAELILRKGLIKASNKSILYPTMTEVMLRLQRQSEADEYLDLALKEAENNPALLVNLAYSYQNMKQFKKSDELFEKAIALNPDDHSTLNNYSYSLADRNIRLNEALKMIEKALQYEPNNGFYLDTMGWIQFKLKNYELARKFIEKAAEQRGDGVSAEVLEHLGDVYQALKKYDAALQYYNKALAKESSETLVKKIDQLKKKQ